MVKPQRLPRVDTRGPGYREEGYRSVGTVLLITLLSQRNDGSGVAAGSRLTSELSGGTIEDGSEATATRAQGRFRRSRRREVEEYT
ncbi:hypothetical protein RDE2_11810 [Rhodococcus sp. RDE2]|nr:hypothetical protein RDE2_11810 [Rhodococcus sp. RDE2]